jgi:ElaB/YqjD/DUF883 family membrane-anchored ribosome-binding protein
MEFCHRAIDFRLVDVTISRQRMKTSREAKMDSREVTGTIKEYQGKAEKAYGKLRDNMSASDEEFETFSSTAQRDAEAAWEKSLDLVRDHPASSVGISLLIGAAIGVLATALAMKD